MEINSKDELIQSKLVDYYKNKQNLQTFLEIILQKTRLSLRAVDWFVTNYSKKHNINYVIDSKVFYPFKAYKAQLKAYSKRFCDPFCRSDRIKFDYKNFEFKDPNVKIDHDDYVLTTTGQLNFFRFAIEKKIIEYSIKNISEIEKDMNGTLKERMNEKKFVRLESLRRRELSSLGNKSVSITEFKAVIKFE
jgi:hypothetical protein